MASPPFEGPEVPLVVRTADACFENLSDFPFEPRYLEVSNPVGAGTLRMAYIDEGPPDGPVVLMTHGEPSWSFLYRKLIPVLVGAGFRAIAPDDIGFGRSDKLTNPTHYTFERHIEWIRELVVTLDLREITSISQDWGGPLALGTLAREMDRFTRVVVANTMLHTSEIELKDRLVLANHGLRDTDEVVGGFLLDWSRSSHRETDFRASSAFVATARGISPEVAAAYDAPFPSEWHKAGMRQFPLLIPLTRQDVGSAINRSIWDALGHFDRPLLTLFGDSDPSTKGWEKIFQERVPGAKGQPHQTLERAGHFWQEDCGAEAAHIVIDWIRSKT